MMRAVLIVVFGLLCWLVVAPSEYHSEHDKTELNKLLENIENENEAF